jgi:hypothetical protein
MGWIIELCKAVSRNLKTWMLMADNLTALAADLSDCKINIKSYTNEIRATREIVNRIDEFGSKGAMRAIADLDAKMDKMDDKLGQVVTVHGERLSRIEGIVLNGNYHKTD